MRAETVELTNMCMLSDGKGKVLMQRRRDPYWHGLVFPGGHVEKGEAIVDSVIREMREETGLTIQSPKLSGVRQFWNKEGIRYIVFMFSADAFSGELCGSDEGDVLWVDETDLPNAECVPGFESIYRLYRDDICETISDADGVTRFL